LKAARSENLQIEEPVCCGYSAAFNFHPTLAGMLGTSLIRHQVVQVECGLFALDMQSRLPLQKAEAA
jgi:hypothetical protein